MKNDKFKDMAKLVLDILKSRNGTVATAESCTGGLLAKKLTDCPGSSAIFHLGVVSYANSAKEKILHVRKETLEKFGAVSAETAREMAENIRNLANADYGLSTTGIAGPDGATADKGLGLVYIGLCGPDGVIVRKLEPEEPYQGRDHVRNLAADIALELLYTALSDNRGD